MPVLYRLSFGQREGVSRVWFTLVYVVLSSGHRWMGDILVFMEGVLRELGRGEAFSSRKMSRVE